MFVFVFVFFVFGTDWLLDTETETAETAERERRIRGVSDALEYPFVAGVPCVPALDVESREARASARAEPLCGTGCSPPAPAPATTMESGRASGRAETLESTRTRG